MLDIKYSLGPPYPITTTIQSSTTTSPPPLPEVRIYVVAVNEQIFYTEHFEVMWQDIKSLILKGTYIYMRKYLPII